MHLCYMDESGTPDIPGNTSHFVLVGLSIPVWHWKTCESEINAVKNRYDLNDAEIHTGWILRLYPEQRHISNFDSMSREQRAAESEKFRMRELHRRQKDASYRQAKKNYKNTAAYTHLTHDERTAFIREVAARVSSWGFARLFAEAIDKTSVAAQRADGSVSEQAFEQVVSRFETYLQIIGKSASQKHYGLLVHDNNETVKKKHTDMMNKFHLHGTRWQSIDNIVETPFFVDSQLSSMVQVADLCGYVLRRYLERYENNALGHYDNALFDLVFQRADRRENNTVGVRHYTDRKNACDCKICLGH